MEQFGRRIIERFRQQPVLLGAFSLFVLLALVYQLSIPLRATRGAAITGDEPFYLVTTQSLLQDGDLDLRQQYQTQSYRSFFDHPSGLWRQSVPRDDGAIVSPHDPGLSVLLIPGFLLGGLRGAQTQLALLAAGTFALAYVLAAVETRSALLSWLTTAAVGLTATAFVYASEIYPELPGALCIVLALLLLQRRVIGSVATAAQVAEPSVNSTPMPRVEALGIGVAIGMAVLLSALAWLGIKYVPLGALIALAFLWQADTRARAVFVALSAVSGAFYVWAHYQLFGDLTPYSINAVYQGAPAISVIEHHVAFSERFYRLWGLFIDERFGVGRWAPVLLLVPFALTTLVWGPRLRQLVAALIVVQVLMGTFVAITMMGWWFPGRTLVLVLPLCPLALTVLLQRTRAPLRIAAAGLAAYSIVVTCTLTFAAGRWEVLLAVDPYDLSGAGFQGLGALFPNYTAWGEDTVIKTGVWLGLSLPAMLWLLLRDFDISGRSRYRKFIARAVTGPKNRADRAMAKLRLD